MNCDNTFQYRYSAKENKEVREIRSKYLPREENKLEELRRLDHMVQSAGVVEALCAGIGGALIFGFGFCLTMQVVGNGGIFTVLGVLLGLIGIIGMLCAYPVNRRMFHKTKTRLAPRILELTAELSGENRQV